MQDFHPWFHQIEAFFARLAQNLELEKTGFPDEMPGVPFDVNCWRKNMLLSGTDSNGRTFIIEIIQEDGTLWAATTDPETKQPRQWFTSENFGLWHPIHGVHVFRKRNFGFYEDEFRRVADAYLSGEISRAEATREANRLHVLNAMNPKTYDDAPF